MFEHIYREKALEIPEILESLEQAAEKLQPYITQTTSLLHKALSDDADIMMEGAQGSLLDLDHGTYPYVTSSSPTAGGACTGTGIPPCEIGHVMGVFKAYCTRVGHGVFPTELKDKTGEKLQEIGNEFGAVTGRPRRCGWLDLVALKYSVKISGIDELALTKLDVLNSFEEIKLCTNYKISGEETSVFPVDSYRLEEVEPVYKIMPGWKTDISGYDSRSSLPAPLKDYLGFIEDYLEVKITILSIGPKRSQTMVLAD